MGWTPRRRVIEELRNLISSARDEAVYESNREDGDTKYWPEHIEWLKVAIKEFEKVKVLPKKPNKRKK